MIVDREQVVAALPGYELGARLGRGAFGLVLAARHRGLGRQVAIKIVPAGPGSAAEAQMLASLDHPHIVRVHDYVEADDLCLIVMELLAGGTLTRRRNDMPAEGACAVGLAVAAALSCAHAHGVLHRDIKTDNMLFDDAGLLKVTDFGIAKIVEGPAATASQVVGTPAYMAPEQITGGRLGPATDVYALGAVLYQLLAGAPPFDPTLPVQALWQHHLATTPAPPPGVPAPVAQVVLTALAKDPGARHPSAHAFALELAEAAADAYGPGWGARSGLVLRLDDEIREAADYAATPTRPAPPPRTPPTPAAPAATVPATADVTADADVTSAGRGDPPAAGQVARQSARQSGGRPPEAVPAAAGAGSRAPELPNGADMPSGPGMPDHDRPTRVGPSAGKPVTSGAPGILGTPGGAVERPGRDHRPRRSRIALIIFPGVVALLLAIIGTVLAVSPERGEDPGAASVDAASPTPAATSAPPTPAPTPAPTSASIPSPRPLGALLSSFPAHPQGVEALAFAPDGATLASGGWDNSVRLWDVSDPASPRQAGQPLTGHTEAVQSMVFFPAGDTLASASTDATVRLWDVSDLARPRLLGAPLAGHTRGVETVAISPSGDTLASAGFDATVRLWDVSDPAAPRLLATLDDHIDVVWSVAFSPDGAILASSGGSGDGTVRLWDVADPTDPRHLATLDARTDVGSVAFSPDGRTLASGGADEAVRLWDVSDPANPREFGAPLTGHTLRVNSVAFSSDGVTLVSVSGDGSVRLWDMADLSAPRSLRDPLTGHTGEVRPVAFSRSLEPGGAIVASGGTEGTVRLWAAGRPGPS